jgi:putative Mg2+ transporter-C (MgtC) family protein
MNEPGMTPGFILLRLALAGVIGAVIGYERRVHHKAIGVSGLMLVAIGSATFMLLAKHESEVGRDTASISRTLQGLLQGIGFLGGAVIFKGGTDVKGIKTAAAIWITGAIGLSIGTGFWWLGTIVGIATALILFVADIFEAREQQNEQNSSERSSDNANAQNPAFGGGQTSNRERA